jgi:hypothetical protein
LDVINPVDYSDPSTLTDTNDVKIARPMVHAALHFRGASKLEAVFVPNFQGSRYEMGYDNRWAISQIKTLPEMVAKGIAEKFPPDTSSLKYAQGALRFTTTTGPADWGVQYYYGRLSRPSITLTLPQYLPQIDYYPYHHTGVDYAQVVAGFNVRAEFSANITDDTNGDKGDVYNPFLAWSLGFDRSLFWNIKLNLQANEKIRLAHDKISDNPALDTEAGTDVTSTRITAILSRAFLQDKLGCEVTGIWDIEDKGCYIIPSLSWTQDDISVELAAGIFAGDDTSELGQYHDNSFIRLQMTYSF